MSVNMLRLRVRRDCQARTKKGQPPHSTTGAASANSIHCTACMDRPGGSRPGARSASMANPNTGAASVALIQKRRVMSVSSGFSSSTAWVRGSSAMPHLGQLPG